MQYPGPCFTPVLAPLCQNDLSHLVISFLALFFHQVPSEGDPTSLLLKPGSLELWALLSLPVSHPSLNLFSSVDPIHSSFVFFPCQ